MEQTLDNIAYEVVELLRANRIDDSEIDLRLIKERIKDLRALYIYRELSKVGFTSQAYVQDLGCISLEEVDPIECDNISGDNYILRTTVDIPRPVEANGKLMFTRIGPIDKTQPNFNYYNYEQTYYSAYKRFGKNLISSFYRNGRIYLYADECVDFIKLLDSINIQGVFEDPTVVSSDPCFDTTEEFPLPMWMKENIMKTIVDELLRKLQISEDKMNDGTSE